MVPSRDDIVGDLGRRIDSELHVALRVDDGGNKLDHLSLKNDISALDVDKRDNTKNENNRSEANSSKHDFKNLLTAKRQVPRSRDTRRSR